MNHRWQIVLLCSLMATLALPQVSRAEIQTLPATMEMGQGVPVRVSMPFELRSSAPPDFPVRLRPVFHFDFDGWKRAGKMEWEGIRVPVVLTNTSERTLYYYGKIAAQPTVRLFKRQSVTRPWRNITFLGCGVGVGLHELAPGKSLRFEEFVDLDDGDGEVYLEVTLYPSKKDDKQAFVVSSAAKVLK